MLIRRIGALMLLACAALGAHGEPPAASPPEIDAKAWADAIAPSLVRVHFTLRADEGAMPRSGYSTNLAQLLAEERPLMIGGYLIAPDLVALYDGLLEPRFVESVTVRQGDGPAVNAVIDAFGMDQRFVLLRLERPIDGSRPLTLDPEAEDPAFAVDHKVPTYTWWTSVTPLSAEAWFGENGSDYRSSKAGGILLDSEGRVAGVSVNQWLRSSRSIVPSEWSSLPSADFAELERSIGKEADATLLRTELRLRSPRNAASNIFSMYAPSSAGPTEWTGVSIVLPTGDVLTLADLTPQSTARLEQIRLFNAEGQAIEADFVGSLREFGAFVARPRQPIAAHARVFEGRALDLEDTRTFVAEVAVRGDQRSQRIVRSWLERFELGWRNALFPTLHFHQSYDYQYDDYHHPAPDGGWRSFLYTPDGELAAAPLRKRSRLHDANHELNFAGGQSVPLAPILASLGQDDWGAFDPDNVPRAEEEEGLLAWFGLETQGLNPSLARLNKVVDATQDGRFGALVSYVYPDSPAALAGVAVGDVLVRIHSADQPRPVEVRGAAYDMGFDLSEIPWEQIQDVDPEMFEHLPPPWPPARNMLRETLSRIGIGKEVTVEIYRDGARRDIPIVVARSPRHFDEAPRHTDDSLGVTVRDATFEVRRHFQMTADAPGVIVSKVEPGSPAAVAGLKPYELITAVNGSDIRTAEAFKALVEAEGPVRFSLRRLDENRVIEIRR